MATDDKLIQVHDLKKYYNHGAIKALDGVTVDINRGDVMVVIGPSGSGKSTLLRCATLLETIDGGSIRYLDMDAAWEEGGGAKYASPAVLKQVRACFGLVFQNFNLFPHFSVLRNVTDAPIHVAGRSRAEAEEEGRATVEVTNRFKGSDLVDRVPEEQWMEVCDIVQEAVIKTISKKKKCKDRKSVV